MHILENFCIKKKNGSELRKIDDGEKNVSIKSLYKNSMTLKKREKPHNSIDDLVETERRSMTVNYLFR